MFCDRCGVRLEDNQSFCRACGKSMQTIPLMPVQGRIAGHVRLLGIFWLAISAFRFIPGIALLTIFGRDGFPPGAPPFVSAIAHLVGLLFVAIAFAGFAVGFGLLNRDRWARMLALVFGGVGLLDVPFGTALGIYTLWTLLPAQSEAEYRQFSRAA
jgi:hypothetical protein